MVTRELVLIFKEIVRPRDFSFQGIVQPERVRRRLRLASGVIKGTITGKFDAPTRKALIDEFRDAILDSPFLRPFVETEEARLRGLRPDPEGVERRSREIEAEAQEAAKKIEAEVEKAIREARKRTGG
ncbi:MAG: hypothetical protein V3U45_07990 [bacterium]